LLPPCLFQFGRYVWVCLYRANITSANIAFFIRHQEASYHKKVGPSDIFIGSRNYHEMKQGIKPEGVQAGLGVFVNGNGWTHTVVRILINKGDNVLELLNTQVDKLMLQFFPAV
jgi:hypothetical protein